MNKIITLNATGETIEFTRTSTEPNGGSVEMNVSFPENCEGPGLHRHVLQTEHFEALEGKLGIECDGKKMVLEPGQSFTIPANALHRCYSADGKAVRFKATFTPAASIEYILTEIFEACNRKNSKDPSPFDACYILKQAKGEYYLGDVPTLVQKTIFPLTASFSQLFRLVKARPNRARSHEQVD